MAMNGGHAAAAHDRGFIDGYAAKNWYDARRTVTDVNADAATKLKRGKCCCLGRAKDHRLAYRDNSLRPKRDQPLD
jgi:hypothetical protein